MSHESNGTCGSCNHFGDGISPHQLVQIRVDPKTSPDSLSPCSAPRNAAIHLSVGPNSGCDAWTPAA